MLRPSVSFRLRVSPSAGLESLAVLGVLAGAIAASPASAGGSNVRGVIDNRNGAISAYDGGSGDPAEFEFVIDPRIAYDPLTIDQTTQVANRVAHLVHGSQWFGTNPNVSTTGFTISETYTVSKPTGPGYAQGDETSQVVLQVTGAPGGGIPWLFSGSLTETNADATITLVGPGVNETHNVTSTWTTPVLLVNGEYTLTIDTFLTVNTNPAATKSIGLSVTLSDNALAAASGVIINPVNGHRYQLVKPASWNDFVTFAAAQNFGGTFGCPLTINDGLENQWVRCYLASNVPTIEGGLPFSNWVGLSDAEFEGDFVWWCAEPVAYTNWMPGEPNNGGNADFTELMGDTGQWRDRGNAALEYGVVEYEFIACGTGGGCFTTHATPGCNNESCCQTICFIDNYCCLNEWDTLCVNEANGLCSPPVLAGPIVNPANDHSYFLLETGAWSEAEEKAMSLNGHLATINNNAENTWVLNNVSRFDDNTTRICFIGFNDQLVEGSFQWVDHGTSTYSNWDAGEPNNSGGVEHFAEMLADGKWRDNDNTGTAGFTTFAIVEVPCLGDLDGNGTVDGGDLGSVLGAWGTTDKNADLNMDGKVDGADLGLILGGWGPCGS
jgi:hypothetical protein